MNLAAWKRHIQPIIFPVSQHRVDVWFNYYARFDPDMADLTLEDMETLSPQARRLIVKKALVIDRVREMLCEEADAEGLFK